MKAKTLKKRYPNALLQSNMGDTDRYFHYYDGYQYLLIPQDQLSDNEKWILQEISIKDIPQSAWYDYLMREGSIPIKGNHLIQCFHFHTENLKHRQDWLINLAAFFDDVEDYFFINEKDGVLISRSILTDKKHVEAALSLLDDDFGTQTKAFIGIPTQIQNLRKVFEEERRILNAIEENQSVKTISEIYLRLYFIPKLQQNAVFEEMRSHLQHEEDAMKIIQTLWKNQGNLSASSKDLHLHRNTLLYRLNKMEEQVGLNLRDLHQLFLAYLLTF